MAFSGPTREPGWDNYRIPATWVDLDRAGHFAAHKAPDLLIGDIRAFYSALR